MVIFFSTHLLVNMVTIDFRTPFLYVIDEAPAGKFAPSTSQTFRCGHPNGTIIIILADFKRGRTIDFPSPIAQAI
jgi:hypothetical protein